MKNNLLGAATLFIGFAVIVNVSTAIFVPNAGGLPGTIQKAFSPKAESQDFPELEAPIAEASLPGQKVEPSAPVETIASLTVRPSNESYRQCLARAEKLHSAYRNEGGFDYATAGEIASKATECWKF